MTLEEARKLVGDWWDGPGNRPIEDWLNHIRVLEQLKNLGYNKVRSIYDLNKIVNDARLAPIVINMLYKFKTLESEEILIRCLDKPIYMKAVPALIERYKSIKLPRIIQNEKNEIYWRNKEFSFRDSISYILCKIKCKDFITDYLELITNDEYIVGGARLIALLYSFKNRKALEPSLRLLNENPDYYKWIIIKHIGNYKDSELVQYVEPFLNDSEAEIRQMAKKAIERLKK